VLLVLFNVVVVTLMFVAAKNNGDRADLDRHQPASMHGRDRRTTEELRCATPAGSGGTESMNMTKILLALAGNAALATPFCAVVAETRISPTPVPKIGAGCSTGYQRSRRRLRPGAAHQMPRFPESWQ
jgi:hypothetical protein